MMEANEVGAADSAFFAEESFTSRCCRMEKKKKKESRRRERAVENRESGYEAGNIVRETKQRGRLALQSVWGGGGGHRKPGRWSR